MRECRPAFQETSWYNVYQCSENISFYGQLFVIESALVLSSNIMLHSLVPVSNTDMPCKELSACGSVSLHFLMYLGLLMLPVLAQLSDLSTICC